MASVKDEVSEVGEADELSSDFFDDFTKDDFMAGLSVLDECSGEVNESNSDNEGKRQLRERIDESTVIRVKDLRELIGDNLEDDDASRRTKRSKGRQNLSTEETDLDNFIKPGSRRDRSKTNEAIKKDKEVKVQQFLAKTLESADELRPPGTELDEYYEEYKKDSTNVSVDKEQRNRTKDKEGRKNSKELSPYPQRSRHSPRRSPPPSPRRRYSPHISRSSRGRFSPRRHFNPHGKYNPRARFSPHSRLSPHTRRVSPRRHYSPSQPTSRNFTNSSHVSYSRHGSPHRRSPVRRSVYRRSPEHHNPRRHVHRSRSPQKRTPSRRTRSRSRSWHQTNHHNDTGYSERNPIYKSEPASYHYDSQMHPEFSGFVPVNSSFYPQTQAYGDGFSEPYNYVMSQDPQVNVPGPGGMSNVIQVPAQPVLIPNVTSVPATPTMVPAPINTTTAVKTTPYDALAQLVAEGKISQEDYLKLTPHKGVVSTVDTKTRVMVLSRCSQALTRLREKLLVPNRLIIHDKMIGSEDKHLAPKYCSPLKRQLHAEFNFTKGSVSPTRQSKQLVESIVSTLGLDKVVSKYKKKFPKDVKDAAVQTSKPQCDICEIREATKYHDVGTSTDPEYLTSTVHTQVVEQDLISSKNIFNPSGSVGEGSAISIAHLTPAQLVSQLAARAKTLKQPQEPPPPNQYSRRPPSNYDYDNRGSQYHHSYNNYRY